MDLATILGFIIASAVVFLGMVYDTSTHSISFLNLGLFIDIPAFLIIILGSFFCTVAAYPISILLGLGGTLKKLVVPPITPMVENLSLIVDLSKIARKNILALEDSIPNLDSPLLKGGLRMVIDRMSRDAIVDMLHAEVKYRDLEMEDEVGFFKMLSTIVPSFGLVGTLLGLIVLLQNLQDTAKIGPALAIAFVATFYGVLFSNGLYYPMFTKLATIKMRVKVFHEMIRDGVLMIEKGERPELIEQVLINYLTPEQKGLYEDLRFKSY
ncbi:MAG: MotA/TolQ/ExbB proton channel family protein [SAR324 cluster bacterium]|nr:MotA/TolQ/ExbB proton channel family protein [SAR324 cluster bacterium]